MTGKRKIDDAVVDAVFNADGSNSAAEKATMAMEVKDTGGNVISTGSAGDVIKAMPTWVARVSQIHMTMKVTPQIKGVFVGVEKGMTIELNTFDPSIVDAVVQDLEDRIISDVFNGLSRATKIIEDSKKV